MKLSNNFSLDELLKSPTAVRCGFDEQLNPGAQVVNNLQQLCKYILQPLRDYVENPIKVTSGYRCPRLNAHVGGSRTSDHMLGQAADIELHLNNAEHNHLLYQAVLDLNLPFHQIIWEYGNLISPDWVHVSYRPGVEPKRQQLIAIKTKTGTKYEPFIYKKR